MKLYELVLLVPVVLLVGVSAVFAGIVILVGGVQ